MLHVPTTDDNVIDFPPRERSGWVAFALVPIAVLMALLLLPIVMLSKTGISRDED